MTGTQGQGHSKLYRDITALLGRLESFERPVLTVYANVQPGRRESSSAAVLARLKNSLRELEGVPAGAAERVVEYFTSRESEGRSVALFATPDQLEVMELPVDAVDDTESDRLPTHLGEPMLTPLLVLDSGQEPHLVVYCERDHLSAYGVQLGRAEPLHEARRQRAGEQDDVLTRPKDRLPAGVMSASPAEARNAQTVGREQSGPKYQADRGDAARQLADEGVRHSQARFYREQGAELRAIMDREGLRRVILLGADRERHLLFSALPHEVAACVTALTPASGGVAPTATSIPGIVGPHIEAQAEQRKKELLDAIAEGGITGLRECLDALQQGRLYTLAVAVPLEKDVYVNPKTQFVTLSEEEARPATGGNPERRELAMMLPELARAWGAQLEYVEGEPAQRLHEDFGGMGGLPRW